jgi:hypothetical protein
VLLNRHPSPLDQSNEEGYALEVNYNFSDETSVIANYGITQTLPTSSYYQRVNNSSNLTSIDQIQFHGIIYLNLT